jgi:hypothetical protein
MDETTPQPQLQLEPAAEPIRIRRLDRIETTVVACTATAN